MAAHRALAYKCKAQVMHSEVFAFRGCSKTMQAAYLDGILSFQGVLPMWTLFNNTERCSLAADKVKLMFIQCNLCTSPKECYL